MSKDAAANVREDSLLDDRSTPLERDLVVAPYYTAAHEAELVPHVQLALR